MKTTTTLKAASEHGGPVILGAGLAVFAVALISSGHFRTEAVGARPGPTVTVTHTQAPVGVHRSPHPPPSRPTPALVSDGTVVAASEPPRGTVSAAAAEQRPSSGGAGRPSPPPTSPLPCSGIAAVQLLGRCALTVGGSR
jgi:hypothetical protein